MINFKKALILSLCLSFVLCSCGNKSPLKRDDGIERTLEQQKAEQEEELKRKKEELERIKELKRCDEEWRRYKGASDRLNKQIDEQRGVWLDQSEECGGLMIACIRKHMTSEKKEHEESREMCLNDVGVKECRAAEKEKRGELGKLEEKKQEILNKYRRTCPHHTLPL